MTSKLKCPFCGAKLRKEQGSERWWYCVNAKCVHKYTTTHETIWQALIQAKQDLKISRKALKDARILANTHCIATTVKTIDKAIEQIEHKDNK